MFGYAANDTPELMPLPISLAHKLAQRLTKVRKDGTLSYLRPDGKTQVTCEFDETGKLLRVDSVVVSTQHSESVTQLELRKDIKKHVEERIAQAQDEFDNSKNPEKYGNIRRFLIQTQPCSVTNLNLCSP